jgi:hypothetical protein
VSVVKSIVSVVMPPAVSPVNQECISKMELVFQIVDIVTTLVMENVSLAPMDVLLAMKTHANNANKVSIYL